MRRVLVVFAVVACVLVTAAPASASSGGRSKPSDPFNAPTFQQQTKNWTPAQFQAYNAKLAGIRSTSTGHGPQTASCPFTAGAAAGTASCIIPNSAAVSMDIVWEGSADCACGPATATEMFTTYYYYYGQPSYKPSLGTVESQMGFNCSKGTYRYQLANELNNGTQAANSYVWQNVNSASDVHYYTKTDIGGYAFPIAYDGETYGPDGHPLDNYPNVNWQHYFPAYGYALGVLDVADPHFAYDHQYTDQAIYLFIDNFPYTNQVLW